MDLILALEALLEEVAPCSHGWCYKHRRRCAIPLLPAERVIHCAGPTCVDWSSRSRQPMRWLGVHMVPSMAWSRTRREHCEHLVIHECVAGHPSEVLLQRSLGKSHLIKSFLMCPSIILGYPCQRRRRFTLCIGLGSIMTPLTRSPDEIWSFSIVATASIYFNAEQFELDGYMASTGTGSFRALLPPGAPMRSCHGVKCVPCACMFI